MILLSLKSIRVDFSGYFVLSQNLIVWRIKQHDSISSALPYQPLVTATMKLLWTEWLVCDNSHTQTRACHLWGIVKYFASGKPVYDVLGLIRTFAWTESLR